MTLTLHCHGAALALLFASIALPAVAHDALSPDCETDASNLIGSLSATQKPRAMAAFTEGPRQAWSYRPGSQSRKEGVRTGEMSDEQRRLAHALIGCGLSAQGYQKAAAIMRLDDVARETVAQVVFPPAGMPVEVGKEYYWLTLFGDPLRDRPWGWQLEGHHLALNFTAVDGAITVTPAFFGADPAEIQTGPLAGFRVLDGEEHHGFALMAALTSGQKARALLAGEVPRGLFSSPERQQALQRFEGLPAAELDNAQQQLLWQLIDEYLGNAPVATAIRARERIRRDGAERIHFAWMGAVERGRAFYYRVHGPSILIEFDHAANIRSKALEPDPNHIHTLMWMPGEDYGGDLLARHYRESPHHQADVRGPTGGGR
jgi:hypothetical protein